MPNTFRLIIVTPEKPVLEKEVAFVSLPSYGGEMGVLKGHVPCVVQLNQGLLHYTAADGTQEEFAVMGGFAEVYKEEVSVFAEGAELAEEINEEVAKQNLQQAKKQLTSTHDAMDIEQAQAAIKREALRMKLASRNKVQKNKRINPR